MAVIQLQRPSKRNAFSSQMADCIVESSKIVSKADSDVRALILTGTDSAFCAGRDLKASADHTPAEASEYLERAQLAVKALLNCPVPVVVGIEMICLGLGLELALAGDLRIAGRSTQLGFPEINLSLFPGCGGAVLLPGLLNVSIASDWIFTGRQIPPDEAKQCGLLHRVVDDGQAYASSVEIARHLAGKNRSLLVKTKSVIRHGFFKTAQSSEWFPVSEKYRKEVGEHPDYELALRNFYSRENF